MSIGMGGFFLYILWIFPSLPNLCAILIQKQIFFYPLKTIYCIMKETLIKGFPPPSVGENRMDTSLERPKAK